MAKRFNDQILDGMDVFDANNQKVGNVAETAEGYLRVPTGFLGMGKEHYIPLSAIGSVDGGAIHLSVASDRLDELECALRRIRTAGTVESERSVRRESYGGFGEVERVGLDDVR